MLSAHYDSYFDGFQDDNTAISMMLSDGKNAAGNWISARKYADVLPHGVRGMGRGDSQFDWSTGAYEQVFTAHPGVAGKRDCRPEFLSSPALAHGRGRGFGARPNTFLFWKNFEELLSSDRRIS